MTRELEQESRTTAETQAPTRLVAVTVLRATGQREVHPVNDGYLGPGVFRWIQHAIDASTLTAIDLPEGEIVVVDYTRAPDAPVNAVATALCQAAGLPELVRGDAALTAARWI